MPTNKQIENDPAMKQYFDSLPPYVQENIKQAGSDICSLEELKSCAQNLMRGQN
ncbi:MAG: hypothetical protein HFG26_07250 [Provencibacterium sp.]|nr:hypothetical protein [Provencibacterium sp.]